MEDIENSIADWQPDIETPEIQEDSQPNEASSDKEKRYLEQLKWRTEQAKIEKFARQVLFNPSKLLELWREEWEKVVRLLYNDWQATTDDYDEILESIKPKEDTTKRVEIDEDEIIRKLEAKQLKKETERVINDYLSKYDEAQRTLLLDDFKEYGGNNITDPIKAKNLLDRLSFFYKKNDIEAERKDNALQWLASTSIWKKAPQSWPKKSTIDLAKRMWYSEREMKELWLL